MKMGGIHDWLPKQPPEEPKKGKGSYSRDWRQSKVRVYRKDSKGQWEVVHNEALNSKWAKQVGQRAYEIAEQLQDG